MNSFVVQTTIEFTPGFAWQSSSQIKFCQDFSIGNNKLLALSPAVYQLKVEIIDLVKLLVIIVIC